MSIFGKPKTTKIFIYIGLVVFALFSIFPIFWMMLSSLFSYLDLVAVPPKIIPSKFSLEFYKTVLFKTPFLRFTVNSLIVSLLSTFISVASATTCAYAIDRIEFRGKKLINQIILIAYIFPQIVLVIPLFVGLVSLGLANTLTGLSLTHVTFSFPFAMLLLVPFFHSLPRDLEEAARVDGATNFLAFRKITLPLALPGIATATIFCFGQSWREFLYAFVIINRETLKTLPVGLYGFIGGEYVKWGEILAAGTMVSVPMMVFFLFTQQYIISGLATGGVKG